MARRNEVLVDNFQHIPCRTLARMDDAGNLDPDGDWEKLAFDCPNCGAEGAIQVTVKFTHGRSEEMFVDTPKCPSCNAPVNQVIDEV